MIRSRANRRFEGYLAPAVFFPSSHRFGNCFKSEDTIVMDSVACFSSAKAIRSAVFRARSKKTAPDTARQSFATHLRAIEDDQP
jgi:hypothetical protein